MSNMNFELSSKKKSLENYNTILKIINYQITLDGSTLVDNLTKNHQVDYLSSALIPAKSIDKVQFQEHLAAVRYRSRN